MKRFIEWLQKIFRFKKKTSSTEQSVTKGNYSLKFVSELPQEAIENIVYVEGNKDKDGFYYALLKCPCGCTEDIMLNLMNDTKPCWKIKFNDDKFSVYPSVWRTKNCRSHFFLTNNKVVWVIE
jgi:predicted phosphodiesterase